MSGLVYTMNAKSSRNEDNR